MLPAFVVASLHLRLNEPSEFPFYGPSYTIALLISALYDVLTMREDVSVDPYALIDDQPGNILSHLILLELCPLDLSPKPFTAAMGVFAQSSGPDRQPWRMLEPF